ncbi:MAG: hypothetical protein QOE35_3492 [Actinomycetota bacterium]|jgi:hypothetical protein
MHRPIATPVAALLVLVAFVIGGLFGASVMVAAAVADRRTADSGPTVAGLTAVVLLALAGVFSVLGGTPKASELTPAFASDRGLAAAAALGAGMSALYALVGFALAERERHQPLVSSIDRRSLSRVVVAGVGGISLLSLAIAVRAALAPAPLRVDFAQLVINLRLGDGYTRGVAPALDATALHPPLAPLVAAILPGVVSNVHVLVSALVVLATAGLGARLGGVRGAVGAGLVAAVLPSMWGQQLPEALAALGVTCGVLFAWPDRISAPSAALSGACLALGALSRPEAGLALPVVVVWIAMRSKWNAAPVVACALAAAALMGPWMFWTHDRFGTLLPSTSLGATLAGANLQVTTRGLRIGELDPLPPPPSGVDEGVVDATRRNEGFKRLWSARTPVVVGARIGRAWDLWAPWGVQQARTARGLTTPGSAPGVFVEAAASLVLMVWLWLRRRNWRRLLPFYGLPLAFTLVSALTFGSRDIRSWTAPIVATAVGLVLGDLWRRPLVARSTPVPRSSDVAR